MIISKHERATFVMLHRRLVRPVIITGFLAILCYVWLVYHAEIVVLIPQPAVAIDSHSKAAADTAQVPIHAKPRSRIAKVTVAANALNTSIIEDALRTHQVHNELHGYKHHITTAELVSDLSENDPQHRPRGAWSKPAYLLSLIVAELTKPESERTQWLFWFDADTLVMNPHTPLEVFLPPTDVPDLANVHLLMASNWDGLNSGAFGLRVHPWSVSVLSAVLAYPLYKEEKLQKDRFRDQSAFQWLLQSPESFLVRRGSMKGTENWAEVPMRWFNSLPINNAFSKNWEWIFMNNMTGTLFDNGTTDVHPDGNGKTVQPWKVMQGDMIVHFAGTTNVRESWMGPWLARAKQYLPEWSNATRQEGLKEETQAFWKMTANRIQMGRKQKPKVVTNRPPEKGVEKPVEAKPLPVAEPTLHTISAAKTEAVNVVVEVVTVTAPALPKSNSS